VVTFSFRTTTKQQRIRIGEEMDFAAFDLLDSDKEKDGKDVKKREEKGKPEEKEGNGKK
jgi:hypothetical protein